MQATAQFPLSTEGRVNKGFATDAAYLRCALPGRDLTLVIAEDSNQNKRIEFKYCLVGCLNDVIETQSYWVWHEDRVVATTETINEAIKEYSKRGVS